MDDERFWHLVDLLDNLSADTTPLVDDPKDGRVLLNTVGHWATITLRLRFFFLILTLFENKF